MAAAARRPRGVHLSVRDTLGGRRRRRPRPAGLLTAGLVAVALVVTGLGLGAGAAQARGASALQVSSALAWPERDTVVSLTLLDAGVPVASAPVHLQRRVDGAWRTVAELTTDADGRASSTQRVERSPVLNVVRLVYDGSAEHDAVTADHQMVFRPRTPRISVSVPSSVVDEHSLRLTVTWTGGGAPVRGIVAVEARPAGGSWSKVASVRTTSDGVGSVALRPRVDTRYRVRTPAVYSWLLAGLSSERSVDNRPPGTPVVLPAGAPSPKITLPAQPRAVGSGANAVITSIPDSVWKDMVGRSWHSGCPVGRSGLRLLRINYYGYDGYRHRGELVAATSAIDNMAKALRSMHDRRLPIRSMYRVDRFGWSSTLQGANDYRSMEAGNTSAFNCRNVVGTPGVRSPHATGRSLDVNTWENPYRSRQGVVPNTWWISRSNARYAWRTRSHIVVRVMALYGLRWTYGIGDTQHFDA